MKKIILVIMATVSVILTANAQHWSDYRCELPEGMYTTGEQWHYERSSVLETNRRNQYLSVSTSGTSRLVYIPPKDITWHNKPFSNMRIYSMTPYSNGSQGYWYVSTDRGFYLVSERHDGRGGHWQRQTYGLVVHEGYRYSIKRQRNLVFVDWHICPRSYKDNHHYNRPNYHNSYNRPNYNQHRHHHHYHRHPNDRRPTGRPYYRK